MEPSFSSGQRATASPFLPATLKHELTLLGRRSLGLICLALALGLALSFVSYNPLDPSWNTRTPALPSNWIGGPGAWIADILHQGLGWAAWLPMMVLASTGLSLCAGAWIARPLCALGWSLVALLCLSACLALLLPTAPVPGGLLGFVFAALLPTIWLKILAFPIVAVGLVWALSRILGQGPGAALTFLRRFQLALPAPARRLPSRSVSSSEPAAPGLRPRRSGPLFAWVQRLLRGERPDVEDPATAQSIPQFLQRGPAVEEPYSVTSPDADCEPSLVSEAPDPEASDREPTADAVELSHRFVPLEGALEDEEIELITQRPAAQLVETAQLAKQKAGGQAAQSAPVRSLETANYDPPPLSLLYEPQAADRAAAMTQGEAEATAQRLEATLRDYGVKGEIVRVLPGPVVTLYELEPAPGTKTSRVVGLADDIARSLAALSARIAPVPGKSVIGIELPNPKRETVFLHEMLNDSRFVSTKAALPLALGKDIGGQAILGDLAKMPHLLVAGTTGSGKSVAVNTMILSLVYALSPEQVRFIMIDPKILELSVYDGIPHLLSPVVTDPKKAVVALKWVVQEMNQRYQSMSTLNVRNIANYNSKIKAALAQGETLMRQVQVGFCPDSGEPVMEEQAFNMRPLPHIVVIVDEMAELMLMVGKDIEAAIQSIAQKARAAGIHMIMATQRPSVDVITGTIKANFPSRISFAVSSKIDSRTVLNEMGAEQLLGQGDMLYQQGGSRTLRVHGPFASDDEVEAVVAHLRTVGVPDYVEAIGDEEALEAAAGPDGLDLPLFEKESSGDALYDQAVQVVLKDKKASTSHVQRRLQIGYNRAANLIDRMEQEGLITPADHVGRRKVLVPGDSADTG